MRRVPSSGAERPPGARHRRWKEFVQIRRDWRTLAVVIVLPVLMLVLYGYAINFDLRHVALGVQDHDRTRGVAPADRRLQPRRELRGRRLARLPGGGDAGARRRRGPGGARDPARLRGRPRRGAHRDRADPRRRRGLDERDDRDRLRRRRSCASTPARSPLEALRRRGRRRARRLPAARGAGALLVQPGAEERQLHRPRPDRGDPDDALDAADRAHRRARARARHHRAARRLAAARPAS